MKLRSCFLGHQLLFLMAACVLLSGRAWGQSRVVMKDGKAQEVTIVGVSGSTVQVRVGAGTIGIPISSIAEVVMPAPPEFAAAAAALDARDYKKALASAKPLVDKYRGLPVDWAQQASAWLGDIYLALNDSAQAETAYKTFQKVYPGQASAQADVGMARLAVAKKDFKAAKDKLAPITEQALKEKVVPKALAPAFSQAFYLLGQVREEEKDFTGALEAYLTAVTLFPADRVAANAAQERADAIRKERGVAVP